jgi:hypothetical protein
MLKGAICACVVMLWAAPARAQEEPSDDDGGAGDTDAAAAPSHGPGAVAALKTVTEVCRNSATRMREIATECRNDVASGSASSCAVNIKDTNRGDISLSPDEADATATKFDGVADQLDAALPDVERLEKQIIQDQRAFKVLRIVKSADDYVAWEQLAQDAQDEFRKKTLETMVSLSVAAGLKRLDTIRLTPGKAKDLVTRLQAEGLDDAELFEDITALGRSHAHHARIDYAKKVLERLGQLNDTVGLLGDHGDELVFKTDAMLMQWLLDDPRYQLFVTDVDWAIQSVYSSMASNIALSNINALNAMSEKDLKSIKILSGVLKKHTDQLVKLGDSLPHCEY